MPPAGISLTTTCVPCRPLDPKPLACLHEAAGAKLGLQLHSGIREAEERIRIGRQQHQAHIRFLHDMALSCCTPYTKCSDQQKRLSARMKMRRHGQHDMATTPGQSRPHRRAGTRMRCSAADRRARTTRRPRGSCPCAARSCSAAAGRWRPAAARAAAPAPPPARHSAAGRTARPQPAKVRLGVRIEVRHYVTIRDIDTGRGALGPARC